MASTDPVKVLGAFQSSLDDIRCLASCKVCLRPFYEPFMLRCGHTFCYGCLRSWFCGGDNRKRKKSCPECRSAVKDVPAPNYVLRDLAHMFVDRAELLPEGETLEEHHAGKVAEAKLLADDRKEGGPGIFKNIFVHKEAFGRAMWDSEDHVHRCAICGWELEDGMCNNCGYGESEGVSDLSGTESIGSDADTHASGATFPAGYGLSRPSPHVSMHLPHFANDGDANSEEDDNTSDYSDDDAPIPWGYPSNRPYREIYEDEEDVWEDEGEMDSFIDDDDDHPHEVDYDSEGFTIEDYSRRPWPSSPSTATESSVGMSISRPPNNPHRTWGQVMAEERAQQAAATARHRSSHGQGPEEPVTDYDESLDEDVQLTPAPSDPPQRRQRLRVVLDDSDEDESDDRFVDAMTGNPSEAETRDDATNSRLRTWRTGLDPGESDEHNTADEEDDNISSDGHNEEGDDEEAVEDDNDDNDDNNDDDDDDDDDDDIVTANPRSRYTSMHRNHQEQRSDQRRQRNFNAGHGFHPYARRGTASANSRRDSQRPKSRGNSRTTVVH